MNVHDMQEDDDSDVKAQRALGWLALVAAGVIVWLARPFALSVLLGALLAFTIEPVYEQQARRSRRPVLWAVVFVIATGAVVLAAAAGFVTLFVTRIADFANGFRAALAPGGRLATWLSAATTWLGLHGITGDTVMSRLEAAAGEIASQSAVVTAAIAGGTFRALLGLFFALLTMFVVLRYWTQMTAAVVEFAPLNPAHTRALLREFQRAGRTTPVVTGLTQGVFAGVGFWISGVPQPAFFGAATALASLVPGVGTMLVWVPAGLFLVATGHPGRAIVEMTWCAVMVIALSDYVIRPRLVGDENMPALLVFVALFGGLEVFGLAGLIMGPILMAVALATLRLYVRERRSRERPSAEP
jgi:predicted PurR-regulated permease PerM